MVTKGSTIRDTDSLAALLIRKLNRDAGRLVDVLRDNHSAEHLANQLQSLMVSQKGVTVAAQISDLLKTKEEIDVDRFNLLNTFHQNYTSKAILTSAKSIRTFAQSIGTVLEDGKHNRQNELKLLTVMSQLPIESLRSAVAAAANPSDSEASSLGLWHEIIAKNGRSQQQ
jgi:hypothetical protein